MQDGVRLNKFLASCAVGSRRACDDLIQAGRVEVNGSPCLNLGTRISDEDHVRVDGKRVIPKSLTTVVFHKPRGYVCTHEDELGRDTIYSLLPGAMHSLHHVGRLDRDSEGLLILTNDGDLSQRLMHPSKAVEKEYFVTANQSFENAHLDQFLAGIYTPEGKLKAKAIERLSPRRIRVVLEHGAKRQIRVMFDAMGYQVTKLLRVRIGSLWLGDLEPGRHAVLSAMEIGMLLANPGVVKPQAHSKKPVIAKKAAAKKVAARKVPAKKATQGAARPVGRKSAGPRGR